MPEDTESPPQLGESKQVQTVRMLASGFALIPVVGSIIQTVIAETIPNIRAQRIEAYLRYLAERIDKDALKLAVQCEAGLDLFEEGLWQAARAVSEVRKERVAQLVMFGLEHIDDEYATSRLFMRTLNLLDEKDIALLLDEYKWSLNHNSDDITPGNERRDRQDEKTKSRFFFMSSLGLLNQHATWSGPSVVEGVTPLGLEFLKHLGLAGRDPNGT